MDRALNYLALARKAGLLELGEEPVGAAARANHARLVVVASDASDHSWRRALSYVDHTGQQCLRLPYTKVELGIAIRGMLGFNGLSAAGTGTVLTNALPLIAVCLIGCSRLPKTVKQVFAGMCGMYGKRRKSNAIDAGKIVYVAVCFLFTCLLIWLSVVSMIGTTSTPSLYADF